MHKRIFISLVVSLVVHAVGLLAEEGHEGGGELGGVLVPALTGWQRDLDPEQAGEDAVVLAGAGVPAHAADQPRPQPALDSRLVTQRLLLHVPHFTSVLQL